MVLAPGYAIGLHKLHTPARRLVHTCEWPWGSHNAHISLQTRLNLAAELHPTPIAHAAPFRPGHYPIKIHPALLRKA